jgi:hypothetical protein
VAHPGGSGSASYDIPIDYGDPHAASGEFIRAGRTYNAGSYNDHVVGCFAHAITDSVYTRCGIRNRRGATALNAGRAQFFDNECTLQLNELSL